MGILKGLKDIMTRPQKPLEKKEWMPTFIIGGTVSYEGIRYTIQGINSEKQMAILEVEILGSKNEEFVSLADLVRENPNGSTNNPQDQEAGPYNEKRKLIHIARLLGESKNKLRCQKIIISLLGKKQEDVENFTYDDSVDFVKKFSNYRDLKNALADFIATQSVSPEEKKENEKLAIRLCYELFDQPYTTEFPAIPKETPEEKNVA